MSDRPWWTCLCGRRVTEHSLHHLECEVVKKKVEEWEASEEGRTFDALYETKLEVFKPCCGRRIGEPCLYRCLI